jgi:hypothetical protein
MDTNLRDETSDSAHRATHLAAAIALMSMLALAGCGGSNTTPPAVPAASAPASSEAVTRIGDVSIHASVVQTSVLAESVAREYGITRDPHRVLLLVAVRRGPDAEAIGLPAQVVATVTDLRGRRQDIVMRELRSGDLLDYIGTVEVDLPDTLRFDVAVTRAGGATSTLQFNREFHPL